MKCSKDIHLKKYDSYWTSDNSFVCPDCCDQKTIDAGLPPWKKEESKMWITETCIASGHRTCQECGAEFSVIIGSIMWRYKGHPVCPDCCSQEIIDANLPPSEDAGTKISSSPLEKALATVRDHMGDYGSPTRNHRRIGGLWSAYINNVRGGVPIDFKPHEVAMMMILVKIARLMETPNHEDSIVDIAGYAEVYHQIVNEESK